MVLAQVARVDVDHVAPAQKQKRTWRDYIWVHILCLFVIEIMAD